MKRSFNSGLLKPACDKLIDLFLADGVHLGRAKAHEIIASALGFWTYKLARDHGAPLSTRKFRSSVDRPTEISHLRLVTERIERVLEVDTWTAQRLAPQALATVAGLGIIVDGLAALFESNLPEAQLMAVLKAIDDPNFDPSRATAAIGRRLIPMPARRGLQERFGDSAPQIFPWLASTRGEAFLWERPTPQGDSRQAVHEDYISFYGPEKHARAVLGLDFIVLIRESWDQGRTRGRHSLLMPTLHFDSAGNGGWHVELVRHESHLNRPGNTMDDILGSPIETLPRLHACRRCFSVYADTVPGLQHRCDPPVDGVELAEVFANLAASQSSPPTTDKLVELLADRKVEVTSAAELEAFMLRNRWALGTRRLSDGSWFVRPERQRRPSPADRPAVIGKIEVDEALRPSF